MFESFRTISVGFLEFLISYENFCPYPRTLSVAGLSDLNFVVAAGAGWDEFSKTNKRKASDSTEVEVKLHDTALVPELVLGCINTDRCE